MLETHLNKDGSIPDYYDKDSLVITGTTPTKFESYVYVDYYAVDGTVVAHLFPNRVETVNRFGPNTVLTVGPGKGLQPDLTIDANPAGLELVTVIASKNRLFLLPRYDDEQAEAYVKALRQELLQNGVKSEVTATFHFIKTHLGR
jgi:hypothetical protein